jgi:hypothetical protein
MTGRQLHHALGHDPPKSISEQLHVRATGLRDANDTEKFWKINYDRPHGTDGDRGNQS